LSTRREFGSRIRRIVVAAFISISTRPALVDAQRCYAPSGVQFAPCHGMPALALRRVPPVCVKGSQVRAAPAALQRHRAFNGGGSGIAGLHGGQ